MDPRLGRHYSSTWQLLIYCKIGARLPTRQLRNLGVPDPRTFFGFLEAGNQFKMEYNSHFLHSYDSSILQSPPLSKLVVLPRGPQACLKIPSIFFHMYSSKPSRAPHVPCGPRCHLFQ